VHWLLLSAVWVDLDCAGDCSSRAPPDLPLKCQTWSHACRNGFETCGRPVYTLHHYRDKDKDEVDIIVENEQGALIGIEVKASATVHASDFKGLRKMLDVCGDHLKLGVVLDDGTKVVPFGNRLSLLLYLVYGPNPSYLSGVPYDSF
jgi:hypothetical protein